MHMSTPEHAARQLHDLTHWAPLLHPPSPTRAHHPTHAPHATRQLHDLAHLLTPTLNTTPTARTALTRAHITTWATHWATYASLTDIDNPLHALATHAHTLAATWDQWDTFTHDLHTLHTRLAHLTGHAPRTIGPCPHPGCSSTVTQARSPHGAEGPLECERGHTYTSYYAYTRAMKSARQTRLQHVTDPNVTVTARQFLTIWPSLTRDDMRNWTRTKRLTPASTHPHMYSLATANRLARQLLAAREKRTQNC